MKATSATRLCCSCPLSDLAEITLMFLTLILQYLNELVEPKIRDLTTLKPFHTVKVERFKDNRPILLTKFRGELPLEVFTLVADLPIEACYLSHTPPPAIRTFLLATQCLVERPKFVQGVFQRLWVFYLLTRAKCQVSVFHAEVCPNAFTCCRQRSKICVSCRYTYPIAPTTITLYCNVSNSSVPLAVFVKSICDFIKLPFTCLWMPLAKSQCDTIIEQRPARTSGIRNRLKLLSRLDMRSATEFLKETNVCLINTQQLLLHCLTRQHFPVRMCRAFQFLEVSVHVIIVRIGQPVFIPLTLPFMEIHMHLPHIVKQITDTDCIGLIIKWIFIGFHGLSSIKFLTLNEWVGRHVTLRLRSLCLPT